MKFLEVFSFEIYYQLRRPTVWIYFLAVVGLLCLVISEIADYARRVEPILLYSPLAIAEMTGYATKFGLLLIALLVSDGGMRDMDSRMYPLVYTSSVTKSTYLGARFLGTFFVACFLLSIALPSSLFIFRLTQALEPALLGEFRPLAFIESTLFLTLPNVFIATAILYAMVWFIRHAMAAFLGGLVLFVLNTFILEILAGNWELAKLLDPSGLTVVTSLSRSFTPFQLHTETLPLKGFLLVNRTLWLAISAMLGTIAFLRFTFSCYNGEMKWKKIRTQKVEYTISQQATSVSRVTPVGAFGYNARFTQIRLLSLGLYYQLILSPAGLLIPAIAIYSFVLIPNLTEGPMGVPILPTTERIIMYMNSSALQIFVTMLITLFAGRLIWLERDTRMNEISDTLPVANSVLLLSKYGCLALLLCTLQLTFLLAGIAIQLVAGYDELNILLYLQMFLGVRLIELLTFAALVMAFHIMVNQTYIGHLLVMLFYLYTLIAPRLGIEHKLLIFGSHTGFAPSVFYEQTPFLFPWMLFKLYWAGWAVFFMLLANYLWVRGRELTIKARIQQAIKGLRHSMALAGATLFTALFGGLIFYNTNILNEYTPRQELISRQVAYERLYSKYENTPQPQLTATILHVELFPHQRKASVQGTYQLRNTGEKAIDTIHVALAENVEMDGIMFNRKARLVVEDKALGHHIYTLSQPLQKGDSIRLNYTLHVSQKGFSNAGIRTAVMSNGTYFRNSEWLPSIGYQRDRELENEGIRRDNGLLLRKKLPSPYDKEALQSPSAHGRITFEATIGTASDQIAIAPGNLKKRWLKEGRQYFYYVADAPIQNMYHIYSANYKVHRTKWQGVDIGIHHHPKHVLNVKTFEQAIIASLNYYSKNLGAYPFRQLAFVEYTDPGTGGISLPGTIGYSTNFSLLNSKSDERAFDLPFAVAAHEVAHQWWGHQLLPAEVEGAPFLSESLAWYSALCVVEEVYGKEHLQQLLDAMRSEYLKPRIRAGVPLLEGVDGFYAYRKGPLAMYALREYVGEEKVNLALRNLLNKYKAGHTPYATSLDFFREIKSVTPDSLHYLLQDLFEKNTFWELETKKANAYQQADSSWLVSLEVLAQKVQVDTDGKETEIPMDDYIEIGVFSKYKQKGESAFYQTKHKMQSGLNQITIKVKNRPEQAGIDPNNLLIDTEPENNVKQVSVISN